MSRLLLLYFYVLIVIAKVDSEDDAELHDYCSSHRFENLPGGLGFTKEVVGSEYANLASFKAIHCCLRGYRSIEWYKDSRPYPWPGGESSFILYPESANQTIYTQEVRASDAGRYSCRARNDTTTLEGNISLSVLGEDSHVGYKGKPLPTYKPSSQLVPLGGTARFFCEAYIGRAYVPDARNSVTWKKAGMNDTLPSLGRVSQYRVSREDEQVVGSYLVIEYINNEDYGEYLCQISNGIDEDDILLPAHLYKSRPEDSFNSHNGSWRKSVLFVILAFVLLCSIVAYFDRIWMPIALFYHDKFGPVEKNDGKESDILVCCHGRMLPVVESKVIPPLETIYGFKCKYLELSDLYQHWNLEISRHSSSTRRVIIILSPFCLTGQDEGWTEANFNNFLKQISTLATPIFLWCLENPPKLKNFAKCSAQNKNAMPQIKIACYNGRKFWYKLRMFLPKPKFSSPENVDMNIQPISVTVKQPNESNLQSSRSQESLEVLV